MAFSASCSRIPSATVRCERIKDGYTARMWAESTNGAGKRNPHPRTTREINRNFIAKVFEM